MFNKNGKAIEWFGKKFIVHAKGSRGYDWILENEDVTVCIAREAKGGRTMPEVYTTFRSAYLWGCSYKEAYDKYFTWLLSWAVIKSRRFPG